MPDDTRAVALTETRDIATLPLDKAIEAYAPNFAAALPPHISIDHFRRMLMTAISMNPDLYNADRRTLFNSAVKCASDGLLPDGREAALVVYRTKMKDRQGREHYIDAVQYMPMVAGIRKRMRNSGDVLSATAEVVCRNDRFHYRLGDDAMIEHEPPPLDQERGDPIGAYAIIRLASGEIVREVMGIRDIERARAVSRSKDGPAWKNWWSEMARKTVLRRASKAVPQDAMMARLLSRDDEPVALPAPETMPLVPPRPTRAEFEHVDDDGGDPGELPAHVLEREEATDEDAGESVADDPKVRSVFWSQETYLVAKVTDPQNKNRIDWKRTHAELVYWFADARSVDEVRKLQADSKATIDGLKLSDKPLWDDLSAAIVRRLGEFRVDAAGSPLTAMDA